MDNSSVNGPDLPAKRLEFEVLLSDLAERFVNIPPAQVYREIEEALGPGREVIRK